MPADTNPEIMELEQLKRWQDAIQRLKDEYYLWYSYAVRMKLTPCRGWCTTAAVDGKNLFFNPEWTESLNDKKLLFVLIHEIFHVSGGHFWRGAPYIQNAAPEDRKKIAKRVNRAQDGAIHQILVPLSRGDQKDILEFPPEGIYSPDYDNLSFEQIYELMSNEDSENGKGKDDGGSGNDPGGESGEGGTDLLDIHVTMGNGNMPNGAKDLGDGNWILMTDGEGNPINPDGDTPYPNATKEEIQQLISDVVSEVRGGTVGGYGMGSLLRIAEVTESKVNWISVLKQWMVQSAKMDYSYSRPNRRYLSRGLMVPGLRSESIEGVIAFDISGSINMDTYNSFISEFQGIRKELPEHNLHVIWCSDGIHKSQVVSQHEDIDSDFDGSGGTSFKPVFDYVEENCPNPMFLIYFTDGCNNHKDRTLLKDPGYPVLWALNGSYIEKQKWGVNLLINE
jgi:predicted metal-dependent peptidase